MKKLKKCHKYDKILGVRKLESAEIKGKQKIGIGRCAKIKGSKVDREKTARNEL